MAGGFFSGTAATIEYAWVRPRDRWWPAFQLEGGRVLRDGLEAREAPQRLLELLDARYRECRSR